MWDSWTGEFWSSVGIGWIAGKHWAYQAAGKSEDENPNLKFYINIITFKLLCNIEDIIILNKIYINIEYFESVISLLCGGRLDSVTYLVVTCDQIATVRYVALGGQVELCFSYKY